MQHELIDSKRRRELHDSYCVGDGSVCQLGTMEKEHGCRGLCERAYYKGFRDALRELGSLLLGKAK